MKSSRIYYDAKISSVNFFHARNWLWTPTTGFKSCVRINRRSDSVPSTLSWHSSSNTISHGHHVTRKQLTKNITGTILKRLHVVYTWPEGYRFSQAFFLPFCLESIPRFIFLISRMLKLHLSKNFKDVYGFKLMGFYSTEMFFHWSSKLNKSVN